MFGKKDPESEMRKLREQRVRLAAKLQELVQAVADRDEQIKKLGAALMTFRADLGAGSRAERERSDRELKHLRTQLDAANQEVKRLRSRS
ncbi:MAG TPA: hypothetical protein VI893_03820 [Thermoplasmata archaeon]|nr:hypothetical protein [Thermoplasmata archaeon]